MHQILTGPINSGKSTRLSNNVQQWIREGKKVSGWISVPSFVVRIPPVRRSLGEGGSSAEKKEYDIVFIVMSKIHDPKKFIRTTPFTNSFAWRRFYFDQSIFDYAATMDFGKPDIFVIDEVGPLELEDQKGFWSCLDKIYATASHTLTVVRNSCTSLMQQKFQHINFEMI